MEINSDVVVWGVGILVLLAVFFASRKAGKEKDAQDALIEMIKGGMAHTDSTEKKEQYTLPDGFGGNTINTVTNESTKTTVSKSKKKPVKKPVKKVGKTKSKKVAKR